MWPPLRGYLESARSSSRIAGADLRESIYSYPARSPCRVDQELVAQTYEESDWFGSALSNVQGLDAIEYLLYAVDETTECPDAVQIVREGAWQALATDMDELAARRRRMASVLARGIVDHGRRLVTAWSEESEFAQAFIAGTAPFTGVQQVINESYAGLFYMEKVVKDLKLGKLTESTHGCASGACPDALESSIHPPQKSRPRTPPTPTCSTCREAATAVAPAHLYTASKCH